MKVRLQTKKGGVRREKRVQGFVASAMFLGIIFVTFNILPAASIVFHQLQRAVVRHSLAHK